MIEIKPFGEAALIINLEQKIDPAINAKVSWLEALIRKANLAGIRFLIPAYCSLTVGFDKTLGGFKYLKEKLETLISNNTSSDLEVKGKMLFLPVCYESNYALDLEDLEQQTKLSEAQIIKYHTSSIYQVYMLGFLPGFPYLGILPELLKCNRKQTPRTRVPAQSVAVAGQQTGIYPVEAPGGWQIIGRTPIPVFNPLKEDPFLLKVGDKMKFYPITEKQHKAIEKLVHSGNFDDNLLLDETNRF